MTQNSEAKKRGLPVKATPVPWFPVSAQRQPLYPDSCLSIEGIPCEYIYSLSCWLHAVVIWLSSQVSSSKFTFLLTLFSEFIITIYNVFDHKEFKVLCVCVYICMQNMREKLSRKSPTAMNSKICDFIKDQTVESRRFSSFWTEETIEDPLPPL